MFDSNLKELWAITCYFNPMGYRTRLDNYHVFQRQLKVSLVTVELSFTDNFQLKTSDADRLVQIRGRDIMWQKERLLNIAVQELPDHCNQVLWLDCDLVFDRQDMAEEVSEALEKNVLIQPYSSVYDLKQRADVAGALDGNFDIRRDSMAWRISNGSVNFEGAKPDLQNYYSPGHAWAAHRDVVEQAGFYDAMILGSGDFTMAKASVNQCEDVVSKFSMKKFQAEHYRAWSKKWSRAVNGRIGVVEGTVRHLWHGHLDDRGYVTRYTSFEQFDFDPYKDIAISENGCWNWNSDKPEMHEYIRKYFESRKEDGNAGAV